MKNTTILLILLIVVGLIPAMVLRNNHTATVRGYLPVEMGSMESHWVYLEEEGHRLDSTTISEGSFELTTQVPKQEMGVVLTIPDCKLEQELTLRPGKEIELHISLDEYYRQCATMEMIEARARLDERGVSLPDSVWNELREVLIEEYLQKKR